MHSGQTDIWHDAPGDPLSHAMASRDADTPRLVAAALDADRGRLAYQPVRAAGAGRRIAFHEGLMRLVDEAGRVLPARQFLPPIENGVLGRDIDCAALRIGLDALRQRPQLRLAVNMSARSIGDSAWRSLLDAGLARSPGIGARLILEISETSAMLLPEVVIRFMAEMQPRGVCFALDDFGAGMTAFRYLKDFFFDLVKLDPHFVRGIDASPDNQVLAGALITVAHQFEMFAVAPGVETEAEAAMLSQLGIDCLQGYLIGRPQLELPG